MGQPHTPSLRPDSLLGDRYRILTCLGRGGMGTVYIAEHIGLKKRVALKVLHGDFAGKDAETRFRREAEAAARLDHPGCVRVLDHGVVGGRRFLVMELLGGPTLLARRDAGPMAPDRVARIAADLLAALSHAHRLGVLHRDVKPENVVFTRRDGVERAVLIDFGLARVEGHDPITGTGVCVGSPSYVAPERLAGRPYDGRADLYSLGVVLYELLAGRRPFVASSPGEVARAHLRMAPPHLASVRPGLPLPLVTLIHRALEKDPDRRFPDADAMLAALASRPEERATRVMPTFVLRPSLTKRLWAWLRYGRWRWSGPEPSLS